MSAIGTGVQRDESGTEAEFGSVTETGAETESGAETDPGAALPLLADPVPAHCFLTLSLSLPTEDVPWAVVETGTEPESETEAESDGNAVLLLIAVAGFCRCHCSLTADPAAECWR